MPGILAPFYCPHGEYSVIKIWQVAWREAQCKEKHAAECELKVAFTGREVSTMITPSPPPSLTHTYSTVRFTTSVALPLYSVYMAYIHF